MGHLEASAAIAGLASLVLVPLDRGVIAVNAQLQLSVQLEHDVLEKLSLASLYRAQSQPVCSKRLQNRWTAGEDPSVPQSLLVTDGSLLPSTQAYLADHMVGGSILVPGVGYMELSLAWADASCDAGAKFRERLRLKVRGQQGAKKRSKRTVREALCEAKTLSRVLKLQAILREHFTIAILPTPCRRSCIWRSVFRVQEAHYGTVVPDQLTWRIDLCGNSEHLHDGKNHYRGAQRYINPRLLTRDHYEQLVQSGVTPYAAIGLCARLLQCLPTECAYTDLLAPAAATPGCVAVSNWTDCSCFIAGLPDFAWQSIPDKLNADKEIMVILRVYNSNGFQVIQVGLDYNGWMIDFGGAGIPGAFHNPAYLANPPTTSFAKTWCVTSYTFKECWTLYIGEDMETSAAIMAPVGNIIFALILFGIDLLTFMTLFLVTGGNAKQFITGLIFAFAPYRILAFAPYRILLRDGLSCEHFSGRWWNLHLRGPRAPRICSDVQRSQWL
ncbi:hypothetical protein AURANDRAFT_68066 [Aureococcus anophagefferens]|uniref:Polyketide synthase dehydratase domain-containing protein n=1 Tax=Aureococcus anophagefferens TaxID=44056 RepID=F0YND7_AURAN|nr:hypothetical protein AURANDRAFT_68066 [Aureococcus anophagefferens]EGB03355.1 hypothetical protein AURANDRAFT_68066 [Aureococcus anophagefferens]|eukprot:XP_009041928.1 hypothetical protein AURANDRAFT_68066 [Aureococcus anophagefferens]